MQSLPPYTACSAEKHLCLGSCSGFPGLLAYTLGHRAPGEREPNQTVGATRRPSPSNPRACVRLHLQPRRRAVARRRGRVHGRVQDVLEARSPTSRNDLRNPGTHQPARHGEWARDQAGACGRLQGYGGCVGPDVRVRRAVCSKSGQLRASLNTGRMTRLLCVKPCHIPTHGQPVPNGDEPLRSA